MDIASNQWTIFRIGIYKEIKEEGKMMNGLVDDKYRQKRLVRLKTKLEKNNFDVYLEQNLENCP